MPRPRNHAKHVTSAVEDLLGSVERLVATVGAAVAASGPVSISTAEVKGAAAEVKEAASAKSAKLRKALRAYWSKMKGKAREQRIAKMRAGRAKATA